MQYGRWALGALHGDFGMSFVRDRPVGELIMERLPSTAQLAVAALLFAVVVGLALGIIAATHRNSPVDAAVMLVSLGGVSMPGFWLALLLILTFSVLLNWLPATGSGSLEQLVLPAIALGYEGVALVARLTRAAMLDALTAQYVTTARSKGLAWRAIVFRHALRNALIPIVTVAGVKRPPAGGQCDRRNRLRPPGHRPACNRRHSDQGLPPGPGHHPVHRYQLRGPESLDRYLLRLSGSAHPRWSLTSACQLHPLQAHPLHV